MYLSFYIPESTTTFIRSRIIAPLIIWHFLCCKCDTILSHWRHFEYVYKRFPDI